MHPLAKFVQKLQEHRRFHLREIAASILRGNLRGLDIKPLRGYKGYYRCRIADIRIVFHREDSGKNSIVDMDYRSKIYRRWR